MEVQDARENYIGKRKQLLGRIYRNDPLYKDSRTPLLKMLMAASSAFSANTIQRPVMVVGDGGQLLATAVLIVSKKMPGVLQMAFFEALPDQQEAVVLLMSRAREIAREAGARRMAIGLDGHVNNGLGFLADSFDSPACFGSAYNPPYYIDYLEPFATASTTLVSYLYDLSVANMEREKKAIVRISRRFKVRKGDFGDMRKEIGIYTQLNNACFRNHPLYYERSEDEDYELFKSFGPFLNDENFLISELEGKPIGFLLWYPDFNELVKPGGKLGLAAALKHRLPGNPISKFKIAEIGILPEHQGSAAIGGLIGRCFEIGKKNGYSHCESGWIFDSNKKSRGISERWACEPHKSYKVFETDLEEQE